MMSDETSDSSLLNGYDLTPEESSAVFCSVKRHCKSKNPSRWQRRRRKTEAIKILKGWQDKGVLPKQSYLNLSDQLEASNVASAEFFKRIGFEKLVEAIEQRDLAVGTSGSKDEQAEKINEEHDVQETVPSSSAFERSYTDGQCHLDDLAREYAAAAAGKKQFEIVRYFEF
jgi:Zn-dependent M32 family carboxypeptidase